MHTHIQQQKSHCLPPYVQKIYRATYRSYERNPHRTPLRWHQLQLQSNNAACNIAGVLLIFRAVDSLHRWRVNSFRVFIFCFVVLMR